MQTSLHRKYGHGLVDLSSTLEGSMSAAVRGQTNKKPDPAKGPPTKNGGNGNTGEGGSTGDADPALGDNAVKNADGTYTINGVIIDVLDWKSLPLGIVASLQYDNKTWGKCFYSTMTTVNFIDLMEADFQAFLTEFDFYTIFVYDPIQFLGYYLATYE